MLISGTKGKNKTTFGPKPRSKERARAKIDLLWQELQQMNAIVSYLRQSAAIAFGGKKEVLYPTDWCCICFESWEKKEMVGLSCGHPFCEDCLFGMNDSRCPTCRRPIYQDKAKIFLQRMKKCRSNEEREKITMRISELGGLRGMFPVAIVLFTLSFVETVHLRRIILAFSISLLCFILLDPEVLSLPHVVVLLALATLAIAHYGLAPIKEIYRSRVLCAHFGLFWSIMYFFYVMPSGNFLSWSEQAILYAIGLLIASSHTPSIRVVLEGTGMLNYGFSTLLCVLVTQLPTCVYLSVSGEECCISSWVLLLRHLPSVGL